MFYLMLFVPAKMLIPYEHPSHFNQNGIHAREGKQNLEFSLKIIVALEMVFHDDNDHVKELPF